MLLSMGDEALHERVAGVHHLLQLQQQLPIQPCHNSKPPIHLYLCWSTLVPLLGCTIQDVQLCKSGWVRLPIRPIWWQQWPYLVMHLPALQADVADTRQVGEVGTTGCHRQGTIVGTHPPLEMLGFGVRAIKQTLERLWWWLQ
jgi:hypothetical protein